MNFVQKISMLLICLALAACNNSPQGVLKEAEDALRSNRHDKWLALVQSPSSTLASATTFAKLRAEVLETEEALVLGKERLVSQNLHAEQAGERQQINRLYRVPVFEGSVLFMETHVLCSEVRGYTPVCYLSKVKVF